MVMASKDDTFGRRAFLRSVFGISTLVEAPAKAAPASSTARFFWTNLKTGQMGFPTGQSIPEGKPGSIMKVVATAALLEARILHVDDRFECRGSYRVGKETVNCLYPHGVVDLINALGLSCNVYFAHASQTLSPRLFLEFAEKFGMNQSVGTFGCGNFPTNQPDSSLLYVLGLADDLQPSALQLLRLAALAGNRGCVKHLHSAEAPVADAPDFQLDLSASTWNAIRSGMQIAGRLGTGKKLDPDNKMHIALKTGTTPYGKSFQSWVCGYFPWTDPHYAFCLRAANGTSYDVAIPALKKFLFGTTWL